MYKHRIDDDPESGSVLSVQVYSHHDVTCMSLNCALVFNISALKAVRSLGSCGSLIFSCIIYARLAFGHYMIRLQQF